ncbi:MAG: recombinase family protein [Synergistaceae bacterium]|nr:recombinase family protein [Synergistaceae bacterium]
MTQDERFRGGTIPFWYKLIQNGRVSKKGYPIGDLAINEQEATVVRTIFDRYVSHGYGTQRICGFLSDNGLENRDGGRFTNTTIQNILKRPIYIGILSSGGVQSEVIPKLQIIPQEAFNRAQEISVERSSDYAERRIPLNTKGNALLSGNIFCGHCNARLTLTTNGKKYQRKDGGFTVTPKTRYVCYNKTRHPEKCDGQTGYTTS